MELTNATKKLAALGQPTRLAIFRALVEAGPIGMLPSELSEQLEVPGATLSFHLKELTSTGLIDGTQDGRTITYTADFDAMNDLIGFLTDNCCGGDAAQCKPTKRKRTTRK